MKRFLGAACAAAVISLLFFSCGTTTIQNKGQLNGYWKVMSALRDKRETKLLADVFFEFGEAGMRTNLPITSDGFAEYDISNNQILQKTNPPIHYSVVELTDSIMVMTMEMNNTPFELRLKKGLAPVEVPEEVIQEQAPTDTLH